MQTHLVPKIMHQNLTIILQQFNYSKNSFIVLVPWLPFYCPVEIDPIQLELKELIKVYFYSQVYLSIQKTFNPL